MACGTTQALSPAHSDSHSIMIFKWFNTEEVDKFTDAVVEAFIANFPPSELQDQRRKSPARFKRASDALFSSAADFVVTHKPNVYQEGPPGEPLQVGPEGGLVTLRSLSRRSHTT